MKKALSIMFSFLVISNISSVDAINKNFSDVVHEHKSKILAISGLLGFIGVGILLGKHFTSDSLKANVGNNSTDNNIPSDNDIKDFLQLNSEDKIKRHLESRKEAFLKKVNNKEFKTTWEGLCYLLGSKDSIDFVKENYPEWQNRLTRCQSQYDYGNFHKNEYENYALMSMAYSLLLAKCEQYSANDVSNNEIIQGTNLKNGIKLIACRNDTNLKSSRLSKVIVEDEDILRSAAKHFNDLELENKKIGFLNAGDPYDPNGFLPNRGKALEEYLSMHTTLVRDLSYKAFRNAFYTTREKFPPICNGYSVPVTFTIMQRLTESGRDFYHERGIMSRNVRLIRGLGNLGSYYNDDYDPKFPFKHPVDNISNFDTSNSSLGSKEFCILSIAGLEDRSGSILDKHGKHSDIYRTWKKITKKQCKFVLTAFINEKVNVPFLCAFGAGCFGGKARMVAKCFRELLLDEGYIDYFDHVIFPIGYDKGNFNDFKEVFSK